MQYNAFLLATAVAVLLVRLWSTLRALPWGPAKTVIWVAAAVVVSLHIFKTVRVARRLMAAGSEGSARDVYVLASAGILLAVLALSVPHYLPR